MGSLRGKSNKIDVYTDEGQQKTVCTYNSLKNRKYRDVVFAVLIVLLWAAMAYVADLAHANGDINRLIYGRDSSGNLCGTVTAHDSYTFDATSMPYLYYFDPLNLTSYSRCVTTCPNVTFSPDSNYSVICQYGVSQPTNFTDTFLMIENGTCTPSIQSQEVLYRCVPFFNLFMDAYESLANSTNTTSSVTNLTANTEYAAIAADFDSFAVASKIFNSVAVSWNIIGMYVRVEVLTWFSHDTNAL